MQKNMLHLIIATDANNTHMHNTVEMCFIYTTCHKCLQLMLQAKQALWIVNFCFFWNSSSSASTSVENIDYVLEYNSVFKLHILLNYGTRFLNVSSVVV